MIKSIFSIFSLLITTLAVSEPTLISPAHAIGDGGTLAFTIKKEGIETQYFIDGRAFDDDLWTCCDTYGSIFIGYPDSENSRELRIKGKEELELISDLSQILTELKQLENPKDPRMHEAILLDLSKLVVDLKNFDKREEVRTRRSRQLRQTPASFTTTP